MTTSTGFRARISASTARPWSEHALSPAGAVAVNGQPLRRNIFTRQPGCVRVNSAKTVAYMAACESPTRTIVLGASAGP